MQFHVVQPNNEHLSNNGSYGVFTLTVSRTPVSVTRFHLLHNPPETRVTTPALQMREAKFKEVT